MKKFSMLAFLLALAACGGTGGVGDYGQPSDDFAEESLDSAASIDSNSSYLLAAAPKYYIGSAYKIEDVQYVPAEDLYYNQTGIAGIVPVELNGAQTSNGETFDVNQMLATSKTLPLPTIARITNLENGSSVVVRVNNRGPFVNSRVADLSPAAARKIGMTGQTKIQIQVLADQSTQVKKETLGLTAPAPEATTPSASGPYSVQVAAFYSEDSAQSLANRLGASIVQESGMYKVRITGLDAAAAKAKISYLQSSENMAPGLLKDGKWVNADSI